MVRDVVLICCFTISLLLVVLNFLHISVSAAFLLLLALHSCRVVGLRGIAQMHSNSLGQHSAAQHHYEQQLTEQMRQPLPMTFVWYSAQVHTQMQTHRVDPYLSFCAQCGAV